LLEVCLCTVGYAFGAQVLSIVIGLLQQGLVGTNHNNLCSTHTVGILVGGCGYGHFSCGFIGAQEQLTIGNQGLFAAVAGNAPGNGVVILGAFHNGGKLALLAGIGID